MDDVAPHRYPSRAHSDATPGRGIHPPRAPRVHYGTAVHDGSAILPLLTAIVSAVLAARVGGAAVRRFSPSKPFWAAGLLAFAIAAAAEAYGAADGWGAASFRLYYLFGGCLCVALLGIGSAWLVLPRSIALVISGMAATAVVAAAVAVLLAPVDLARLAGTHGTAPPVNAAIGGHVFLWAIVLNVAGSLLVSGGSLVSLARRRRTVANVGDSRAYIYKDGELAVLTEDQTWVHEVGRRLGIEEAQLKTHPMRHVLTMAIGAGTRFKAAGGRAFRRGCWSRRRGSIRRWSGTRSPVGTA